MDSTPTRTPADRWLQDAYRWALLIVAVGVLVQAVLASQGLFESRDVFTVHEVLGSLLWLLTLVLVGIAVYGRILRTASNASIALAVLLALLMTAQVGLGYATRDDLTTLAWHLPNGVLLMGVSTAMAAQAWLRADHRTPS